MSMWKSAQACKESVSGREIPQEAPFLFAVGIPRKAELMGYLKPGLSMYPFYLFLFHLFVHLLIVLNMYI